MTKIFFVRHAHSVRGKGNDRTRPVTPEGLKDTQYVLNFLKDKGIDAFYSSPYKICIDTLKDTAKYFNKEIIIDERLRERERGEDSDDYGMFYKRWLDKDYHENGGESIHMVQDRNMEAIRQILVEHKDGIVVVGTHETALSSILNYYDPKFGCDDFLRLIDWMPYVIELQFEDGNLMKKKEWIHIYKEFKSNERADIEHAS